MGPRRPCIYKPADSGRNVSGARALTVGWSNVTVACSSRPNAWPSAFRSSTAPAQTPLNKAQSPMTAQLPPCQLQSWQVS